MAFTGAAAGVLSGTVQGTPAAAALKQPVAARVNFNAVLRQPGS